MADEGVKYESSSSGGGGVRVDGGGGGKVEVADSSSAVVAGAGDGTATVGWLQQQAFPTPCQPHTHTHSSTSSHPHPQAASTGLLQYARMTANPFAKVAPPTHSMDDEVTGGGSGSVGGAGGVSCSASAGGGGGSGGSTTATGHSILRPSVLAAAASASHNNTGTGMEAPALAASYIGNGSDVVDDVSSSTVTTTSKPATENTVNKKSTASFILKPPTLTVSSSSSSSSSGAAAASSSSAGSDDDKSVSVISSAPDSTDSNSVEGKGKDKGDDGDANIEEVKEKDDKEGATDVPASSISTTTTATSSSSGGGGGFVFGSNMSDRVINVDSSSGSTEGHEIANANDSTGDPALVTTTATTCTDKDLEGVGDGYCHKSRLEESAREYAAKHERDKPVLDEVKVITGEEDETTALQISCKLYMFCGDKHDWLQRGEGLLKLNDKRSTSGSGGVHSRLVFRTHGTYKLWLNDNIRPDMLLDKASERSVRFSARDHITDDGNVKMYLTKGNSKDMELLHSALYNRIAVLTAASAADRGYVPDTGTGSKRPASVTDAEGSDVAEGEASNSKKVKVSTDDDDDTPPPQPDSATGGNTNESYSDSSKGSDVTT